MLWHLKNKAITLMAQVGNKVLQQLPGLRQGPEILAPDPEGLLIVPVATHDLLLLQATLDLAPLNPSRLHHTVFQHLPTFLQ
jgi:hypothetical protein